jgi:hypothetical protein
MLKALIAVVILRAEELDTFDCLASRFKVLGRREGFAFVLCRRCWPEASFENPASSLDNR